MKQHQAKHGMSYNESAIARIEEIEQMQGKVSAELKIKFVEAELDGSVEAFKKLDQQMQYIRYQVAKTLSSAKAGTREMEDSADAS